MNLEARKIETQRRLDKASANREYHNSMIFYHTLAQDRASGTVNYFWHELAIGYHAYLRAINAGVMSLCQSELGVQS